MGYTQSVVAILEDSILCRMVTHQRMASDYEVLVEGTNFSPEIKVHLLETPMHAACRGGHLDLVKILHEKFPQLLNLHNIYGKSPLYIAIAFRYFSVAKFLYSEGAIITGDEIEYMESIKDVRSKKFWKGLLQSKSEKRQMKLRNVRLLQAVLSEDIDRVKTCILEGADIVFTDDHGNNVLTRLLEKKGPRVSYPFLESLIQLVPSDKLDSFVNDRGCAPLFLALCNLDVLLGANAPDNIERVIVWLLDHGARLDGTLTGTAPLAESAGMRKRTKKLQASKQTLEHFFPSVHIIMAKSNLQKRKRKREDVGWG